MKDQVRRACILSLWALRPDGKRTENDVVMFYSEMERRFPQLLNRRKGDPYQDLHGVLKGQLVLRYIRQLANQGCSRRMPS
jgi:hypothetical protein